MRAATTAFSRSQASNRTAQPAWGRSPSLAGTRLLTARCIAPRPARAGRRALVVQANELNKWADRGGMDDDYGLPNDSWDKETSRILLRVVTARAVQTLLVQVSEFDLVVGNWLNNFAAENPPLEGDKFVTKLLAAKGTVIEDPANQSTHTVDPQQLAHRVLQIRSDMANNVVTGFSRFVELENTSVLRSHLERNTYLSGGHDDSAKERRGYFRARRPSSRPPPKQH